MKEIDWVTLAVDETMKSSQHIAAEQEKELEEERLSSLADQQKYNDLCICGKKLNECENSYDHMSDGC
jgi:hypothetical protein|tara:strand:- start:2259 stop:2462 length:204 start_codon:yes stop_codon:yes gene_type:complete